MPFDGFPVFPSSPRARAVKLARSSRGLVAPFRARAGVRRRRVARTSPVRGPKAASVRRPTTLLGFASLQRLRRRGSGSRGARHGTRHLPASAFRRPRRLAPPATLPAFRPATLVGFDLQGLLPPGDPVPSRVRVLSCRFSSSGRASPRGSSKPGSRGFFPPGIRAAHEPKPACGRYPPGLRPLRALPSSAAGPGFPGLPLLRFRARPEGRARGAPESPLAEDPAFPAIRGAARRRESGAPALPGFLASSPSSTFRSATAFRRDRKSVV